MTDMTTPLRHDWSSAGARSNVSRRRARETALKAAGLSALALAFLMLGILLWTLLSSGLSAFRQTHVTLDVPISAEHVDAADPAKGNYRTVLRDAMAVDSLDQCGLYFGTTGGQVYASADAGDTWTPTYLNLVIFWIIEIPLAYLLAYKFNMGPDGVFWAITIAFSLLAIASGLLFRRGKWKLKTV